MSNKITRDRISVLLAELEALHAGGQEPVDPLDVYEALQAVLAIENALRRHTVTPVTPEIGSTR